jgi:hypothetical protein
MNDAAGGTGGGGSFLKREYVVLPGPQDLNRGFTTKILAYPKDGVIEGERTVRIKNRECYVTKPMRLDHGNTPKKDVYPLGRTASGALSKRSCFVALSTRPHSTKTFTACSLQPLISVNPAKEFAIRLAGKHVKTVGSIKMNISDLEAAASTNAYHNVVLILPKDAVRR